MSETHQITEKVWVTLGLFSDVSNAGWLRNEATTGRLGAVLLDTSLIVSSFHVLSAITKAVEASECKQMKTKTIYSEIIFSLSPSTNISNSFKSFGIKDSSINMLVVTVHQEKQDNKFSEIQDIVKGRLVPLDELTHMYLKEDIVKFYNITPEEESISSLENSVVTRLVIKDTS